MKRIGFCLSFLSLAMLAVMCAPANARATQYSYARIVRISLVSGDVQVARPGHSGWEPALVNMPVEQGFTIGTNDGRAEVQFEDGTTAWIAENSLVQFTQLALADGGRITKLTVPEGTVSIYAGLKKADSFSLVTPRAEVIVPKRSLFRTDEFHDGISVSVLSGGVEVETATGMKSIEKGQTFAIHGNKAEDEAVRANPKADPWDRWVSNRENMNEIEASRAQAYTDSPVEYGMADLSEYGAWNFFPGYGYAWQPWGMGLGWAPFMDGQWMMYPGLGWTWISAEPWGWMPYHFGSWALSPAYGWMWIPSGYSFWNPAPVNWYGSGNQVGWSPAATGVAAGVALNSKLPGAPHILIVSDSKEIGRGARNREIWGGLTSGVRARSLTVPPQMNGRLPKPGDVAAPDEGVAMVPTAPDMNHLARSLHMATNDVGTMRMMRMPSSTPPTMATMSIRNAAVTPNAMPRRPSPMIMRFPRGMMSQAGPSMGMGGGSFPSSNMGASSNTVFSAPDAQRSMGSAAGAPPPASHPTVGRPH